MNVAMRDNLLNLASDYVHDSLNVFLDVKHSSVLSACL